MKGKPRRPNPTTRPTRPTRPTRQAPCVRPAPGGSTPPARPARTSRREAAEWAAALALVLAGAGAAYGLVALLLTNLTAVLVAAGALAASSAVAYGVAVTDWTSVRTRVARQAPVPATPERPAIEPVPVDPRWRARWLGEGVRQREKQL